MLAILEAWHGSRALLLFCGFSAISKLRGQLGGLAALDRQPLFECSFTAGPATNSPTIPQNLVSSQVSHRKHQGLIQELMAMTLVSLFIVALVWMSTSSVEAAVPDSWKSIAYGDKVVPIPDDRWARQAVIPTQLPIETRQRLQNVLRSNFKQGSAVHDIDLSDDSRTELALAVYRSADPSLPDIIEISLTCEGQPFRLLRTRNGIRLTVDLPDENRVKFARRFADTLYELEGSWLNYGHSPPVPEPYAVLLPWKLVTQLQAKSSSNPNRHIPTVLNWHQRVDLIVNDGTLSLLTYTPDAQHATLHPLKYDFGALRID